MVSNIVRVGGTVTVTMPELPSTGYVWGLRNIFEVGGRIVHTSFRSDDPHSEHHCASQGTRTIEVEMTKPGEYVLKFELRRSWERDVIEAQAVNDVHVMVE